MCGLVNCAARHFIIGNILSTSTGIFIIYKNSRVVEDARLYLNLTKAILQKAVFIFFMGERRQKLAPEIAHKSLTREI
jgi:hypothetical protein